MEAAGEIADDELTPMAADSTKRRRRRIASSKPIEVVADATAATSTDVVQGFTPGSSTSSKQPKPAQKKPVLKLDE